MHGSKATSIGRVPEMTLTIWQAEIELMLFHQSCDSQTLLAAESSVGVRSKLRPWPDTCAAVLGVQSLVRCNLWHRIRV